MSSGSRLIPWSLDRFDALNGISTRSIDQVAILFTQEFKRYCIDLKSNPKDYSERLEGIRNSESAKCKIVIERFWIERWERLKHRPETSLKNNFERFNIGLWRFVNMMRFGMPSKKRHWGSSSYPPLRLESRKLYSYWNNTFVLAAGEQFHLFLAFKSIFLLFLKTFWENPPKKSKHF